MSDHGKVRLIIPYALQIIGQGKIGLDNQSKRKKTEFKSALLHLKTDLVSHLLATEAG